MRRAVVGGVAGFGVFAVSAVAALFRFPFTPSVAPETTKATFAAMALFAVLFTVGGVVVAHLVSVRYRSVRYVAIGAIAGGLVWSYLTATWPLTARLSAVMGPQLTTKAAAFVGASAGALAGLLLLAIVGIRARLGTRDQS